MAFRYSIILAICLTSAIVTLHSNASTRGIRVDGPQMACYNPDWNTIIPSAPNVYPTSNPFDPYAILDGNSGGSWNSPNFFEPGTPVTAPPVVCLPQITFAVGTYTYGGDSPNPASQPQSNPNTPSDCPGPGCGLGPSNAALTATGGVMYEWINPTDPEFNPDAEVIVWTLPSSTMFPAGALELEFDNWCSNSDDGGQYGAQVTPSAVPSFTWNGNRYTYYLTCANFYGDDLVLNNLGVLVGYVANTAANATVLTSSVEGWQVGYATTTTLTLSPQSTSTGTCVTFQATVSALPGTPLPTGTVEFLNGTTPLGSAAVNSTGVATFSTSGLSAGMYNVTASYSGNASVDANYSASSMSTSKSLTVAKHRGGEAKKCERT